MEKFVFEKKYQDQAWLSEQYVGLNRSSKDIAKELHISYKLVEIWLKSFNIPIRQEFI
jgi:transposase